MDAERFVRELDRVAYGWVRGGLVERAVRGDGRAVAYGVGQAVIVVEAFDADPEPGSVEYARRVALPPGGAVHPEAPGPRSFGPVAVMSLSPREEGMAIDGHARLGARLGVGVDGAGFRSSTSTYDLTPRNCRRVGAGIADMLELWVIANGQPVRAGSYERDDRSIIDYVLDPYGVGTMDAGDNHGPAQASD